MLSFTAAFPLPSRSQSTVVLRYGNKLIFPVLKKNRRCRFHVPSATANNKNNGQKSTSEQPDATPDEIRTLLTSKTKRDEQRGLLLVKQMPPAVALELLILSIRTTDNDFIRSTATISIGDIDMSDSSIRVSAVSLLSELLATAEDYSVRSAAGAAMGYMSNVDKSVATSLVEALTRALLEDSEWQVHFSCLASLGYLRDANAIPVLMKYLSHENGLLVQAAIGALGDLAAKESVPSLLELLGSEDMMTRQRLAQALSQMPDGATEPAIIDALRTLSKDQSIAVREASIDALQSFGFADAAKAETRSEEELMDEEVVNLLDGNESGNAYESASDALRRRLERSFQKEYADFHWQKPDSDTRTSVPLRPSTDSPLKPTKSETNSDAVNRDTEKEGTAQKSGDDNETENFENDRYDKLVNDLKNGNVSTKVLAAIELRKCNPKLAFEAVISTDSLNVAITPERVRSVCVSLLPRAGAMEKILEVLQSDPEQNVRSVCCDALLEFPGDEQAIKACIKAFQSDIHWLVRISAAITLGTIAKHNTEAEEALLASLSSDGVKDLAPPQDSVIKRHAITALGFLGSRNALDAFSKMLDYDHDDIGAVKYRIAAALSGILCTESVLLARRLACDESNVISQMAQGSLDSLAQRGFT